VSRQCEGVGQCGGGSRFAVNSASACGERDDTKVQCDGSDGRCRVARAFFC